jgi:choline-sulfatase
MKKLTTLRVRRMNGAVMAVLGLFFILFGVTAPAAENRPNVLFLVIDDLNTWLLSNPDRYTGKVIAPNLQRLAASGVNFTQAFTASPKCSPSRTAFLFGVAPWKSGAYDNGVKPEPVDAVLAKTISMPAHFRKHGYYTSKVGKVSHGFSQKGEWEVDKRIGGRDPYPPGAPLFGPKMDNKGKPVRKNERDWGPTHLAESEMGDTKCADFAIAELGKTHDKPFFIACGLFHPHMPWYVPQKYLDLYPVKDVVLPARNPDDLDDLPEVARKLVGSWSAKVSTPDEERSAIQAYLASTTYADAQMGRVLDALEKSPYKDNTIVVLLSDHGFHLGEKDHLQKGTLWEEATHSLLMFRVPGVTKPNQVCARPVSLLDLYPTLADLAGLPKPAHLDGRSLLPLLKDPRTPWDFPALSAYQGHMSIRTDHHRFIRYTDGSTELYDRSKDPREWVNQTNNPEYSVIKQKLADSLIPQDQMAPLPGYVRGRRDFE